MEGQQGHGDGFRDLGEIPAIPLPKELTLRPVRRLAGDEADGVPLDDAVAAAIAADPRIEDGPRAFADYLRSLPPTFRLFAAVESNYAVRATSGSGVFGRYANVIFVKHTPRVAAPRHRPSDDGRGASCCS